VLKWICERVEGTGQAQKTPIGNLPAPGALDLSGLNLSANDLKQLLGVDIAGWKMEIEDVSASYATLGAHLPKALSDQLDDLRKRLG
jgi:phosphoenolpyruvate carboxykinase (GTP)